MNHLRKLGLASFLFLGLALGAGSLRAAEESGEDSAAGLPPEYAKNYWVARSTISRDEKFVVIYPTLEFSESKDFLVADSSHCRPDRIARDRDVNRIFEIADLPLVRIPVRREFDEAEIAQHLLTHLGSAYPIRGCTALERRTNSSPRRQ